MDVLGRLQMIRTLSEYSTSNAEDLNLFLCTFCYSQSGKWLSVPNNPTVAEEMNLERVYSHENEAFHLVWIFLTVIVNTGDKRKT